MPFDSNQFLRKDPNNKTALCVIIDGKLIIGKVFITEQTIEIGKHNRVRLRLDPEFRNEYLIKWNFDLGEFDELDYFMLDFKNCNPPLVLPYLPYLDYENSNIPVDNFLAELRAKYFNVFVPIEVPPPIIDKGIIKFIKDENGNVLLKKIDDTLITSFNPIQNLVKIPAQPSRFRIQSTASFGTNPFILDYTQVNIDLCEPQIVAVDFNTFLIELAKKFFYNSCCKKISTPPTPYTNLNKESTNAPIGGDTI
jgi:hypothetical protein